MKNLNKTIFLFAIVSILASCTGGRIAIVAPNLEYPVSTTSSLYDQDFNVLDNGNYEFINSQSPTNKKYDYLEVEFDENGEFVYSQTRWSFLWTTIAFSSYEKDVSVALNNIMEKYNADGVVNFKVGPKSNPLLNAIGFLAPIIPTYVTAELKGKLIKLKKE